MDKTNPLLLVAAATIAGLVTMCQAVQWDQSTYLDENFRLLWNIQGDEITFEMQVRTHGYIGLGFARKEDRSSADVVIGWVDHGQTYFQVRQFTFPPILSRVKFSRQIANKKKLILYKSRVLTCDHYFWCFIGSAL